MGDFNVNLINYHKNRGTYEFLEQFFNYNFTPQITLPTRITVKNSNINRQHFCKWPSKKV